MIRLNNFAWLIILFVIVSTFLTILNVISLSFTNILAYSLLATGMALVYSEIIRQNKILIFLGSIIFLLGVFFLISENFDVHLKEGMSLPIIMIFTGAGMQLLYISTPNKKSFLAISVILLAAGLTFFILNSNLNLGSFFHSLIAILKFFWPVLFILIFLILLLRVK